MPPSNWKTLLTQLQSPENAESAIEAAKAISKKAKASHVPDLYELMQSENFFIRETAATPLARLEGLKALPVLFQALQRGEDEGHDNDGLSFTIIELIETNKSGAVPLLLAMLESNKSSIRADAAWALGFAASEISPQILFDVLNHDPDPEVMSVAAESLQVFLNPKSDLLTSFDTESSNRLDIFNGKWKWLDCEPHLVYGVEINETVGTCLQTNSPHFVVGDVILKIGLASGLSFVGQQIFTNGVWYPITARREQNLLSLWGGGMTWKLERID